VEDHERVARARQTVRREAFRRMVELGLNQTALAEKARISYKTVGRFFNTETWREPAVLRAIAEALDWPADELERRVDLELAREELHDLESAIPGALVLQLGEEALTGLTLEERTELRTTLHAVALQHLATIRARRGRDGAAPPLLAAVAV
jgi:transcriptional regulator with XRE-family HTH domain